VADQVNTDKLQVQVSLKSRAMPELLPISEVARRSGVAASALRFYEDRGLIASERAGSGHRRYPRPVLRRIAFIVYAQRVGLTLEEIGGELAKLPANHVPTRRDWSRLSTKWSSRIDARIAELHRLRLPLTRPLPSRQPRRPSRRPRTRSTLLDRRSTAQPRALADRQTGPQHFRSPMRIRAPRTWAAACRLRTNRGSGA
jgi:MerR family transcriptional regulator, redox-sensitive transcriptional activator SoxR